jgi:hypothetical protein
MARPQDDDTAQGLLHATPDANARDNGNSSTIRRLITFAHSSVMSTLRKHKWASISLAAWFLFILYLDVVCSLSSIGFDSNTAFKGCHVTIRTKSATLFHRQS